MLLCCPAVVLLYPLGQWKILGNRCLEVNFELLSSVRDLTSTWMTESLSVSEVKFNIHFSGLLLVRRCSLSVSLSSSLSERLTFISFRLPLDFSLCFSPSDLPWHFLTPHSWYLHLCLWLSTRGPGTAKSTAHDAAPFSCCLTDLPSEPSDAWPWPDHLLSKPIPPFKHFQGYSLVFLIEKYCIKWSF